jgi:aminobenzoyl-glutamate utilization protein B
LIDVLERHGFSIEKEPGNIETAFVATFGNSEPTIGILAEYDVLSGMSQKANTTEREEIAPNGNGHGCGHNLFAGAALGAALAVTDYLAATRTPGTVKFFGCPGEKGRSGKAFMAREGVFAGLDAALAWHTMGINAIFDMSMLANFQVLYKFKGIASHAAAVPHMGRSALDAVELMNVGVNFLREHIIQEVRIHYAITNTGGFSPNVVQPRADVLYLIRAPKTPQVEHLYERVNKVAQGAAMMTETELEIEFIKACVNVVPNKTLSKVLHANFKEQELPVYTRDEEQFAADIVRDIRQDHAELNRYLSPYPEELSACRERLCAKNLCDEILPFHPDMPDILLSGSSDVGDVSWNVPTGQIVTACYAMDTPEHSWQLVSQGRMSIGHQGILFHF